MDGLTVSTAEGLLKTGDTMSELKARKMQPQKPQVQAGERVQGQSFADTLSDAVNQVNQLQKTSDTKMEQLAAGKTKNSSDVMIAAEKADIALKLMVQVRNKILNAYQEVMKMQV